MPTTHSSPPHSQLRLLVFALLCKLLTIKTRTQTLPFRGRMMLIKIYTKLLLFHSTLLLYIHILPHIFVFFVPYVQAGEHRGAFPNEIQNRTSYHGQLIRSTYTNTQAHVRSRTRTVCNTSIYSNTIFFVTQRSNDTNHLRDFVRVLDQAVEHVEAQRGRVLARFVPDTTELLHRCAVVRAAAVAIFLRVSEPAGIHQPGIRLSGTQDLHRAELSAIESRQLALRHSVHQHRQGGGRIGLYSGRGGSRGGTGQRARGSVECTR
mmetsp:Transcript_28234/g.48383  ORF Transcript_28234/g.48383 Transcript_28234/m.48383 type:complete len:263 (+) Transcript_28234:347-1135(+)